MASVSVTLLTSYSQSITSGAAVNSGNSVRRTTMLITYLYLKQNDVEERCTCKCRRDLEKNDERDQGRLLCVVSCSTELHQLLVLGLRKTCPRTFTSGWSAINIKFGLPLGAQVNQVPSFPSPVRNVTV